ncbi:hypothetical protein [Pseudomonas sp. S2_H01]
MDATYNNGVEACTAAFERLKSGTPKVDAHIGLPPSRVTPAVVSFEAGFDRGYLKKSRLPHRNLILEIEAYRNGAKAKAPKFANDLKIAQKKYKDQSKAVDEMTLLVQNVVAQNLQLVERVRLLEQQLLAHSNVSTIKNNH